MATLKVVTFSAPEAHICFNFIRTARQYDIEGIHRLNDIRQQINDRTAAYRQDIDALANAIRREYATIAVDANPQYADIVSRALRLREQEGHKLLIEKHAEPLRFVLDRSDYDFLLSAWRDVKNFPTDEDSLDRVLAIDAALRGAEDHAIDAEPTSIANGRSARDRPS